MSVLVGGVNNSIRCSSFEPEGKGNDIEDGENDPGSSAADAVAVSSPNERLQRQFSASSFSDSEVEDNEGPIMSDEFVLGPLIPLKEQLEKDKEDESLRRWKEQLLGSVQFDPVEDRMEPEVKVLSLTIMSPGRPDTIIPFPSAAISNTRNHLFTLKEGTPYNFKFTFSVHRNIVSGLTFVRSVWRNGLRVDRSRVMLGTFSPQLEPYSYLMEEETTPSGILFRGTYTAKTKFIDDDCRCHMQMEHTFDIKRDWQREKLTPGASASLQLPIL
eukprot:c26920_g3_i1 orf=766-1581(+)